jgi:hypothetical protein
MAYRKHSCHRPLNPDDTEVPWFANKVVCAKCELLIEERGIASELRMVLETLSRFPVRDQRGRLRRSKRLT